MFNIVRGLFQGEVSSAMVGSIVAFPNKALTWTGALDSQDRSDRLRVVLRSDGPGLVEVPELDVPRIAVYVGKPVRMDCRHGRENHFGLAIHGDIDIIPDRVPSRWEIKETDRALVLRLGRHLLREVAEESGFRYQIEVRSRFRIRDSQIEHIAWALMAEAQSSYASGRLYLDCMATALAVQLLRHHSSVAAIRPVVERGMPSGKLRQVQCYIEENLHRDLSLDMIAGVTGMSTSHLKGTFRMATGVPVHQYVIRRRVERAALLLRDGNLPISQVAVEVGFAHQSHLAMHMKRLLGATPRQVLQMSK